MRILIVDDNKNSLYLLEALLKGNGYEVVSAGNGAEALEKLRTESIDIIVSDVLMPVMDGFKLCKEVKEKDELKNIPFIFYTATYKDERDGKLALKLGADKYILKPAEPDEFLKIIQGAIRDVEKGKLEPKKLVVGEEKEVFELYSERLVNKLEKKMLDLEREITERKQAEEKLKEYSEHLEEMVEERTKKLRDAQEELVRKEKLATLGQLAGGVGHELRNPLGVISNSVYFLNMKLKDADEKTLKHLNILKREVERASMIITSLLDFSWSKLPSREEGDANDIVKNALASIEMPENISVETQLDENLPKIPLDFDQIQQVFQNIISNSVQAMRDGGKLRIKTAVKGKFAEIMFEDTGESIAKENLSRIFEPLFTTKARGIGLGLAIVKDLIDGHKGRIEVKSEVGEGTTIIVKLPLDRKKGE